MLGHVQGYLLQERSLGTGVMEAGLGGRAKSAETIVSKGLCTGLVGGGLGGWGVSKGDDSSSNHLALGAEAAQRG